jgi:tRNA nucleotidyltransferase (CCA-adding enzyme)
MRDGLREGCLDSISGKRLFRELKLICMETEAGRGIRLLEKHGVLGRIEPAAKPASPRQRHLKSLQSSIDRIGVAAGEGFAETWLCWFAGLFFGLGVRGGRLLTGRLGLPRQVEEACLWTATDMRRTGSRLRRLDKSRAYLATRLLRSVPPEGLINLYAASKRRERNLISTYLTDWRHIRPSIKGGRIRELGVPAGPGIGRLLDRILRLKLRGKLSTPEEELEFVKQAARRFSIS